MSKHNRHSQPQRAHKSAQDEFEVDESQELDAEPSATTEDGEGAEDAPNAGLSPLPLPASTKAPASAAQARIYRNTQVVDHDLFKLTVATMRKNISWNKTPEMVNIEHVHLFHTVDSNGRKQAACGQVGGHHHDVEVIAGKDGNAPTLRISGPRKYVRDEETGAKISVPLSKPGDKRGDFHTHDYEYQGSMKLQIREVNIEAAKLQAAMMAVQSPKVEGVVG